MTELFFKPEKREGVDEVLLEVELVLLCCLEASVVELSVDDDEVGLLVGNNGCSPDGVILDEGQFSETLARLYINRLKHFFHQN